MRQTETICCFIPARGGSKSIPRKNIKLLGGKPLISYSIESALKCGLRPIVNTDDLEIAKVAREYGAGVQMRLSDLGQDGTSMFELLKSEIFKLNPVPEIVLLLQPTTPFRISHEIESAINLLELYDSAVSVEEVPEKWNPAQVFVGGKMADGRPIKDRITRRQDFPKAYTPTGSIYAFKASNLLYGSIYGNEVGLLITESKININTIEDWNLCEEELKNICLKQR